MDKQMTASEVVAQLEDGMTIGIGGWGPRRKPMALIREILRSDLKDLTVVSYGGADVGMLCAAGKVKKVVFAFVSLDLHHLDGATLARLAEIGLQGNEIQGHESEDHFLYFARSA